MTNDAIPDDEWSQQRLVATSAAACKTTVADLRTRLANAALAGAGTAHLSLEALQEETLSVEDDAHVDSCEHCAERRETLRPSDTHVEAFIRAGSGQAAPKHGRGPFHIAMAATVASIVTLAGTLATTHISSEKAPPSKIAEKSWPALAETYRNAAAFVATVDVACMQQEIVDRDAREFCGTTKSAKIEVARQALKTISVANMNVSRAMSHLEFTAVVRDPEG